MSARACAVAGVCLALAAAAAPAPLRAQSLASRAIAAGRAQLEAMQQDSAALQFRFALDPRTGASIPERVRAYTLLGIAELAAGHRQPATRAFREALALDPGERVDSLADLHPDLLSTFNAERAALERAGSLTLFFEVPADTAVPVQGGGYRISAAATRRALVTFTVTAVGDTAAAFADTQTVAGPTTFDWDLRLAGGAIVTPGRYRLRLAARDTVGVEAAPQERTVEIERAAIDTVPMPAPIRPADLLAESAFVRQRDWTPLLRSAAFGAAAALLSAVGPYPSGHTDTRAFVVGGAFALGGLIAFVSGRPVAQPLAANIEQNRRYRDQDAQNRASIARANVLARQQAHIRIRTVSAP